MKETIWFLKNEYRMSSHSVKKSFKRHPKNRFENLIETWRTRKGKLNLKRMKKGCWRIRFGSLQCPDIHSATGLSPYFDKNSVWAIFAQKCESLNSMVIFSQQTWRSKNFAFDVNMAKKFIRLANFKRPFPSHQIEDTLKWCRKYGVKVSNGVALLYKAVESDYHSTYGRFHANRTYGTVDYSIGSIPIALDWDGGQEEVGFGLHFCPSPETAWNWYSINFLGNEEERRYVKFSTSNARLMACPVRIADIRSPKKTDHIRTSIKAWRCCAPIWEVTIDA